MANYLLAYHGGGMPETEEARARVMGAWGQWYQGLGDAVVDAGNPVGGAQTISSDGSVTEGGGSNPVSGTPSSQPRAWMGRSRWPKAAPSLKEAAALRSARPSA
jgi:hypothetical protein